MMMRKQQHGVALIMAVLVAALVTAAAVGMASRQQLDVRRTANIFNGDQAYIAALGGEDYARDVLVTGRTPGATDSNNNPTADHLHEPWSQPVVFPFEDMTLGGQLFDMQARFNLNNLLDDNGDVIVEQKEYFERLLDEVGLDRSIAEAVIDWMDDDNNAQGFGGAEDGDYMNKQPAYRAANGLFVSPSELLLIEGIDYQGYEVLVEYVSALPKQASGNGGAMPTPINVNTAPREVLVALHPNIDTTAVDQIIDERDTPGNEFNDVNDFLSRINLVSTNNQPNTPPITTVPVDIISQHFLLNATAEFDESRGQVFSLLKFVSNDDVMVVMRSRGTY